MRDYYRGQVKGINTPKPRWAYGDKFKADGRVYIVPDDAYTEIDEYRKVGLFGFIEVIPETVGRSIGRKDRDDVEIYEGDIIDGDPDGCKSVVMWNPYVAAFGVVHNEVYLYPEVDTFEWEEIKVVGSIHGPEPIDERKEQ